MDILVFLSEFMVPLAVFYIVGFGILSGRPVFDDFLKGASEGMKTVAGILPTLIGLMAAVGILRESGFLEAAAKALRTPAGWLHIPVPLVSVVLVRLVSSSAATGLILDIFKEYGPDSLIGNMVSIMMGCTETIFYTMSVYFMTAGIRKTRWTLPGALAATAAGIGASIVLAGSMASIGVVLGDQSVYNEDKGKNGSLGCRNPKKKTGWSIWQRSAEKKFFRFPI